LCSLSQEAQHALLSGSLYEFVGDFASEPVAVALGTASVLNASSPDTRRQLGQQCRSLTWSAGDPNCTLLPTEQRSMFNIGDSTSPVSSFFQTHSLEHPRRMLVGSGAMIFHHTGCYNTGPLQSDFGRHALDDSQSYLDSMGDDMSDDISDDINCQTHVESAPFFQTISSVASVESDSEPRNLGSPDRFALAEIMQRLAERDDSLDETLVRVAERVRRMVMLISGQGLSDEEISDLPKVCFGAGEPCSCTICMETFVAGELLTSLRCNHFFHVNCVTRWLQHSVQCPLCRAECTD